VPSSPLATLKRTPSIDSLRQPGPLTGRINGTHRPNGCPTKELFSQPTKPVEIWLKNLGEPSAADLKARDDFLQLLGSDKYQKKLKDMTTTKKTVLR